MYIRGFVYKLLLYIVKYPSEIFSGRLWKIDLNILRAYSQEEIENMIEFIRRYNQYVQENISLDFPNIDNRTLNDQDKNIIEKSNPLSFRIGLRWWWKIHNSTWSYESVSKAIRESCSINGSSITETDIQASGLQFIDLLSGGEIFWETPEWFDPYELLWKKAEVHFKRDDIKLAVLSVVDWKHRKKKTKVTDMIWNNDNSMEVQKLQTYLDEIVNSAIKKLQKENNQSIHFLIARKESHLLMTILTQLIDRWLHWLPLWDGCIHPIGEKQQILEIMKNTSQSIFWKVLSIS